MRKDSSKGRKTGPGTGTGSGRLRVFLVSSVMIAAAGAFSVWLLPGGKAPPRSAEAVERPPVARALVDVPPAVATMDLAPPLEVAQRPAVDAQQDAATAAVPEVGPPRKLTVVRGDTLSAILARAPLSEGDRRALTGALESVFDPKRLQPGQDIELVWSGAAVAPRLERMTLIVDSDDRIVVEATETGFSAERPALAHRIAPNEPDLAPKGEPQPARAGRLFSLSPTDKDHPFLDPSLGRVDR